MNIRADSDHRPAARGVLKRRRLLQWMSLLPLTSAAPALLAQAQNQAPPIPIHKLHTFSLRVSDVQRSVAFYQGLFGMAIQARQGESVCLQIGDGPQFMTLVPLRRGETPGIRHIGISTPEFDLDELSNRFRAHDFAIIPQPRPGHAPLEVALRSWTVRRPVELDGRASSTRDFYFADREGLVYQLCSMDHCGGSGSRGEICNAIEPSPQQGLMRLRDINHFTNFMSNSSRANAFYTELFGLEYQAYQGPTMPIVGVGDGLQFLMYVGPNREGVPEQAARTDHVSLSVEEFSVEGVLEKLTQYGLSAREDSSSTPPLSHWVSLRMPERNGAEGGTPELYFSDPDGIHIQLQHVSYCGGNGYFGEICS
ncbi:MAG: VOC family protein [Pseudomonadales bacterium]|nr:VOC family protein [Pseudomonadales bacterium]